MSDIYEKDIIKCIFDKMLEDEDFAEVYEKEKIKICIKDINILMKQMNGETLEALLRETIRLHKEMEDMF